MDGKRRMLAQAVAVVTLAAFLSAVLAPAPALAFWPWSGGGSSTKSGGSGGLLSNLASAVKSVASTVANAVTSAASAVASAAKSAASTAASAVTSAASAVASAAKPGSPAPSSASREHGLPPAGWSFAQSDVGEFVANAAKAVVQVGDPILNAVSEYLTALATGQTVVARGADVYSSAQPVLDGDAQRLPKPWQVTGAAPDAGLGLANADGGWWQQSQRGTEPPVPSPAPGPQPAKRPEPQPQPQPRYEYRTVKSEFAGPERLADTRTRTWVERTAPAVVSRRTETLDFGVVREAGPRREGQWLVWDVYRAVGTRIVTVWAWHEREVTETTRTWRTPWYYHVTVWRDTVIGDRVVRSEVVSRYDTTTPHRWAERVERSVSYGPWRDRTATDVGPLEIHTVRSERREPVAVASAEPPKPQLAVASAEPPKIRVVLTIPDAAKYDWSNYSRYRRELQAKLLGLQGTALAEHMRVLSDEELARLYGFTPVKVGR